MRRGMRTGIATVAVLLYLVVATDRWSEGRAQSPRRLRAGARHRSDLWLLSLAARASHVPAACAHRSVLSGLP